MTEDGLRLSLDKMAAAGVGATALKSFERQYRKLESGETGLIPEDSIEPLTQVPRFDPDGPVPQEAQDALSHLVVIKPNGGLGTSMGLEGPKSLLPVRDGRSFLDLVVAQVLAARRRFGVALPLLLMDSFATHDATMAALSSHPDLPVGDLPLWFLQSKEPKLTEDGLAPVSWPADRDLEWCPPGHGDIYGSMHDAGLLDRLIDAGFWYAFVSNVDNLGATVEPGLAGWFAASGAPYAAEVCRRTANDKKGGHLAIRRRDGRLLLRDTAQTAPEEMDYFTDEFRHPFFHCNNLWWDLRAVRAQLVGGTIGLPLIRNAKTVDPTDKTSPRVVQIETAMGTAIELFDGARAIEVPRDRFVPVKKTNELLILRSDLYDITPDAHLKSRVTELPLVDLGSCYQFIDDFDARIPDAPSLVEATSLTVPGDWTFGRGVTLIGDVNLPDDGAPHRIPDGLTLDGAAQVAALVQERGGQPSSTRVRRHLPLSADDRRLLSDVPPHHGRVG